MRCLLVENYHQFPSALNFGSLPQFFAPFRGQQQSIVGSNPTARTFRSRIFARRKIVCILFHDPWRLLHQKRSSPVARSRASGVAALLRKHFSEPAGLCLYTYRMTAGAGFFLKLTWLALGDDHADPSRGGEQATALGRL